MQERYENQRIWSEEISKGRRRGWGNTLVETRIQDPKNVLINRLCKVKDAKCGRMEEFYAGQCSHEEKYMSLIDEEDG